MRIAFRIFLVVSIGLSNFSATVIPLEKDDVICWAEDVILKWVDFKGKPNTTIDVSAQTATNIQTSVLGDHEIPIFRISNIFVKSISWTTDTTSFLLLQHERLHFDISELYARKIRKGIEELRAKKIKEMDRYTDLIDAMLEEMNKLNHDYDKKTLNGSIEFRQEDWSKRIKFELNILRKYATKEKDCKISGT